MSEPKPDVIHLNSRDFRAEITPHGATLTRFRMGQRDLILGLRRGADIALNTFYAGAIVGPIANRISKGHVVVDAKSYQMECNEIGEAALHSGSDGLHKYMWDIIEQTASSVSLTCRLPDGYSGLPGNRDIMVVYALEPTGLSVNITAKTDKKTPINIAHHPYWALDPEQSKTTLTVDAQSYLPKQRNGLPDGNIAPVEATKFDLIKPRAIGSNATIDHNWCLNTVKNSEPRHVARLRTKDGLQLDIATTEVGLQVYTGSGLPILPVFECIGAPIKPNAGIALEPQGWPDAPNQASFPSIMVDKGETYRQITRYTVYQT